VLTYRRPGDDSEEFTVERVRRSGGVRATTLAVAAVAVAVAAAARTAASLLLVVVLAVLSLLLATQALLAVTSESLTVVRGVGLALETRRGRWAALVSAVRGCSGGGGSSGRAGAAAASTGDAGVHREFLDVERVRSVVINEHVTTTSVRFYMALVVYNRPDMAVAFPVRAEGGGSCRRRWSSPSPSPKAKTKSTHPPPLETPRPQIHTKKHTAPHAAPGDPHARVQARAFLADGRRWRRWRRRRRQAGDGGGSSNNSNSSNNNNTRPGDGVLKNETETC